MPKWRYQEFVSYLLSALLSSELVLLAGRPLPCGGPGRSTNSAALVERKYLFPEFPAEISGDPVIGPALNPATVA